MRAKKPLKDIFCGIPCTYNKNSTFTFKIALGKNSVAFTIIISEIILGRPPTGKYGEGGKVQKK